MQLTERRWKILLFAGIAAFTMGLMLWLGQGPMDAFTGAGTGPSATRKKADAPITKPDVSVKKADEPKPSDLIPKSHKSLADAAADAIPRNATAGQVEKVAYAFKDVADAVSKKKFRDPDTDLEVAPTPALVLKSTKAKLVTAVGSDRRLWEPFSLQLAVELQTLNKASKLNRAEDFVQPWNDIANGLLHAKPKG